MPVCPVCDGAESREKLVDEVFQVDGRYVLVGRIPADVCIRCGEQAFSRETTEKVRVLVQVGTQATRHIPMQVLDFVS